MGTDFSNPKERKKIIAAAALFVVALALLWWTFFGFGGSSSNTPRAAATPTPARPIRTSNNRPQADVPAETRADLLDQLRPVNVNFSTPSVPDARRNIFVFYEPPRPVEKPSIIPTATPTPIPPILLANLTPGMVFARTGDFTLEISGDKFTPQMRVVIDNGSELPTRFLSPQQVSASVPASLITSPGSRQVMLRSSDGKLYSNSATLNIGAPPTPNYTYIGIFGTRRHIDTAVLQDKSSKELLNIQRGDLVGGRFRVTSISEKELVLIDSNLKIKHTLAFSTQGDRSNPLQRPTPRIESEDDEP